MEKRSEYPRRTVVSASIAAGLAAVLPGCSMDEDAPGDSDETDSPENDQEYYEEPDEPPEAVAGGFDLEAARDATADAIHGVPFEVFGHVTYFEDPEGADLRSSEAELGRGEIDAETARHVTGRSNETTLEEDPRDASTYYDRFYQDGTKVERIVSDERKFESENAEYSDFADSIELDLDYYYEAGSLFEFDEPEWNPQEGVYVVEGVDVDEDEIEGDQEVTIRECTVRLNRDGVVVGIATELVFGDHEAMRTDVEGEPGIELTVEEPSWVSRAEDELPRLPVWTYRTGDYANTTDDDDVLYVASDFGVTAVDRFDGSDLWTTAVTTSGGASVRDDGVYFLGDEEDAGVYAVDRSDGSELWSHEVEDQRAYLDVRGDTVFLLGLDYVRAYAADDGARLWTHSTGDESWYGIVREGAVYIGSRRGTLTALDADTGGKLWEFDPPTNRLVTARLVDDGAVYAGGLGGGVFRIDAADGSTDWSVSTADSVKTVALDEGTLYASSAAGAAYAVDPATGSTRWKSTVGESLRVYPAGDAVYASDDSDRFHRLAADDGSQQWTFEFDGSVGRPAITDGEIYVGTGDRYGPGDAYLTVIDATEGSLHWRGEVLSFVSQAPIVRDELVYATAFDPGKVYAFERNGE